MLLMVCLTQAWLLWKLIRFQLRRWRQFRQEQAARKRAAAKQPPRTTKRDSGESYPQIFQSPKPSSHKKLTFIVSSFTRWAREWCNQSGEWCLATTQEDQSSLTLSSDLTGIEQETSRLLFVPSEAEAPK